MIRHIRQALSLLKHYGMKTAIKSELNALSYNKFTKKKRTAALVAASLDEEKLLKQRNHKFNRDIVISILTPVYNTDSEMLEELIKSVINQTYSGWELCFADGSDDQHKYVHGIIQKYADNDSRIKYMKLKKNGGISENTNECAKMASGNYVALLDHDDLLHPSAMYKIAEAAIEKNADFVYTDEVTFKGEIKNVLEVNLKSDYSPDSLRGNNYICHLTAFSKELFDKTGGFRSEYDGSQDHDMILRLTSKAKVIVHIPEILYFWRAHEGSVVEDVSAKEYAIDAGRRAVRDNLKSLGYDAIVTSTELYPTIYKIDYSIKKTPLISIVIPNKNHREQLEQCISSIKKSSYTNFEIIIVDNNSSEKEIFEYYDFLLSDENIKVITHNIDFNYSKLNNFGVKNASGEYIILLNNDTEVIKNNWIEEMLMYAQREDVGAVGAKLLYRNRTVQNCYLITGMGPDGIAISVNSGHPDSDAGFLGKIGFCQNVAAVTAACMMVKKTDYELVNGFDENLAVAYNDVDFCLKLRKAGKLIVYTPFAKLYHYESVSRGSDKTGANNERFVKEVKYMKEKWGDYLIDPYYNPGFSLEKAYVLK